MTGDTFMSKIASAYQSSSYPTYRQIIIYILTLATFFFIIKVVIFPDANIVQSSNGSFSYLNILSFKPSGKIIKAATWNIAAINNNPFEYWITPTTPDGKVVDDPVYNNLMIRISEYIDKPGGNDLNISQIFTNRMYDRLEAEMVKVGWIGVNNTRSYWENDYKYRKMITEFIKDPMIGKKRLASMPDRVTNTINTRSADEPIVTRPTVINCYSGDLSTMDEWWNQWIDFIFHKEVLVERHGQEKRIKVYEMLSTIKKSKYPSISSEEEAISLPLQTLCCALFDAILVFMMNKIDGKGWQPLREDMCNKLNRNKFNRTIDILQNMYRDQDMIFLQEVAGSFAYHVKGKALESVYDVYYPAVLDGDRDQNSFILLRKGKYTDVHEVTDEVLAELTAITTTAPVAKGDLLALKVVDSKDNKKYLLASFHGDTNGLATIPIVTAMHKYATSKATDHQLLFGMDANTYEHPESDQQGVTDFATFYTSKTLNSCRGPNPNPKDYTTFHARTYLQPQLNKVSPAI
jgi:hypothetical protein